LIIYPDRTVDVELELAKPQKQSIGPLAGEGKGLKLAGQWNRLSATMQGKSMKVSLNGTVVTYSDMGGFPTTGVLSLQPESATDFANLFVLPLGKKEP
jgi:hypothetical protein